MLRFTRKSAPARWPFWLLLAAWFCANTPQTFTSELMVWLARAHHFSHQQRLATEAAFILAGHDAPELLAALEDAPAKPFTPPAPPRIALKKIDLSMAATSRLLPPVLRPFAYATSSAAAPPAPLRSPPFEPPRRIG